jgi:hypothetical protein
MNAIFGLAFFVGLMKFLWDENKSNMFVGLMNNLLAAKFAPQAAGTSKGVKQLSGAYHVDYVVNGTEYTLIIPPQKKRVKWDRAIALIEDEGDIDVTEMIKPYAGPFGNFMNFDYHPHHLHRNAKTVTIYSKGMVVRQFGPQ